MSDFKREARYYVIKIKDLTEDQDISLCDLLSGARIPCTDCVVVEDDWPNYEHTWATIQRVSDGTYDDPYAENERLRARVAELQGALSERCDAPIGWISPEKYRSAIDSKMEFFKTIKELRARVAELEDALAWALGKLSIEKPVVGRNIASIRAFQKASKALGSCTSKPFILRKQAEAVENYRDALGMWLKDLPGKPCASFVEGIVSAAEQADRQAQRLRQQADEAEKAGGEQ